MFKNVGAISPHVLQQQQAAHQQHGRRSRVTYAVGADASSVAAGWAGSSGGGEGSSSNRHCSGINSLALDAGGQTLYSAARDSTVRAWRLGMDFERMRESADARSRSASSSSSASDGDDDDDFRLPPRPPPAHSYASMAGDARPQQQPPQRRKFSATSDLVTVPPRSASLAVAAAAPPNNSSNKSSNNNSNNINSNNAPASPARRSAAAARVASSPAARPVPPIATAQAASVSDVPAVASPVSDDSVSAFLPNSRVLRKQSRSVSFLGNTDVKSKVVNEYIPPRPSKKYVVGPTVHSRSFEAHSDWVNDVVLCNMNRSIVTASSDRMVLLWSTNQPTQTSSYLRLGFHMDQVKCLAYSSSGGWVASGGLDRKVMIWDANEGRSREIVGFAVSSSEFLHDKSPKASIYALACNPGGTTIVSGSPDKVVRVWDPRSNKQAIGLTGHRDNIRALLISDDGKWVVSASSDTTIKLWSLAQPQRCMVTYTHYEDSVWCLYSNHPDLDTFWAGGRDGLVTKMSRRRVGGESKGRRIEDELVDCVAVCKEDGPVNKLVAVDDMYIWTATDKSSINRWRDIPFHNATVVSSRAMIPKETDSVHIPAASIIQHQWGSSSASNTENKTENDLLSQSRNASLASPSLDASQSFNHPSKRSMSGTAHPTFAHSLADLSTAAAGGPDGDDSSDSPIPVEPVWLEPDHVVQGNPGICRFALMNNRMHVVTENTAGGVCVWDIVRCVKIRDFEEGGS